MQHVVPLWLAAGLWGLLAGSALLVGAAVGYFGRVPARVIAAVMAFGAGVLISALSFDLMDEAYRRGGFDATSIGFLAGAAVYTLATWWLNHHGAKHRKRSGRQQPSEELGDHRGCGRRDSRYAGGHDDAGSLRVNARLRRPGDRDRVSHRVRADQAWWIRTTSRRQASSG